MKIRAVKIIDGATPTVTCQTEISQMKLVAKRPLKGDDIHTIFRMISDKQVALQRITVHITELVFSLPRAAVSSIIDLFSHSEYQIKPVADCAEIYISGVQITEVPQFTAKVIEILSSTDISILHLTTSQSSVSVLVEQIHLQKTRTTIKAALNVF